VRLAGIRLRLPETWSRPPKRANLPMRYGSRDFGGGRRVSRALALVATSACVASCDRGDRFSDHTPGAGTVVESATADAARWRVQSPCVFEVGKEETKPAEHFERVMAAFRLEGGRIAVADAGALEIRYFDLQGEYIGKAGGSGQGPGEFRHFTRVWPMEGDSIGVYDRGNRRITVVAPDGKDARSLPVSDLPGRGHGVPIGLIDEKVLVAEETPKPMSGPLTYWRDTLTIRLVGRDPDGDRTLARVASTEWYFSHGPMGPGYTPMFGYSAVVALWGNQAVTGTGESYELSLWDPVGEADWKIRLRDAVPEILDGPVLDEYLNGLKGTLSPEFFGIIEDQYAAFPPDHGVPAYSALMVAGDGTLWVRDFVDPTVGGEEPQESWRVFDGDGRIRAVLVAPAGLQILHATKDEVVGRRKDDLGVQSVLLCRIREGE
jgi:hypothetical protein